MSIDLRRSLAGGLVALTAVVALSGCFPDPQPLPPTETTTTTTSTTTTTTTSTTTTTTAPAPVFTVKINEIESSGGTPGDWVELINTGANAADISGWTVLDGHTIHGYPVATFLRGKQMSKFDDGAPYPEFIGDADGHYLRRTPGQDLIPVAGGVGAMAEVSRTLPMIGKNEEGA